MADAIWVCKDQNPSKCPEWARRGLCDNPDTYYLWDVCQKSCGVCSQDGASIAWPSQLEDLAMELIIPQFQELTAWSYPPHGSWSFSFKYGLRLRGFTHQFLSWKDLLLILFSTAEPAKPSADCIDKNKNCPVWAKRGLCTNPYLEQNCHLSCDLCPKVGMSAWFDPLHVAWFDFVTKRQFGF